MSVVPIGASSCCLALSELGIEPPRRQPAPWSILVEEQSSPGRQTGWQHSREDVAAVVVGDDAEGRGQHGGCGHIDIPWVLVAEARR